MRFLHRMTMRTTALAMALTLCMGACLAQRPGRAPCVHGKPGTGAQGSIRSPFCSASKPLYTRSTKIFTSCFPKVTIGLIPAGAWTDDEALRDATLATLRTQSSAVLTNELE